MYDAILISTHYNYSNDGKIIPHANAQDYEDLSMDVPLGIVYVAQYLHDCGFKVRVVHIPQELHSLRRFGINDQDHKTCLKKILENYPSHVCGIQAHWYLYCGGAFFIATLYKEIFPDSKVLLGGYMATALWKQFLKTSNDIDGVVLGEGEKTIRKILEKCLVSKDCNFKEVHGFAFKNRNDDIIYNPTSDDSVLALHEIPIIHPDAPTFNGISWQRRGYMNISRGVCPEACAYCVGNNQQISSRNYTTFRIDHILEQLQVYQKAGFREIFLGENHFLDSSFMTELVENIIRQDLTIHFELETHPLIFGNKKLLEKMIQSKFSRYTMGCESGSNSLLKRMGRRSNPGQIVDSVKRIAERGGIVLTSWVSNLPGETSSEFLETQELLRNVAEAGGFVYWIENLHVLPGSALYEEPQNWNIEILLKDLKDWIRWSTLSKRYVTFEEAYKEPMRYLTHLNRNVSPQKMIERFYSNRRLALSLVPKMKSNLEKRFSHLDFHIVKSEMQALEWYENKGWKLWLF